MSQNQQTVLRVQTNKPNPDITITGTTSLSYSGSTIGMTVSGNGTSGSPYVGTFDNSSIAEFTVTGNGVLFFDIQLLSVGIGQNFLQVFIKHPENVNSKLVFNSFASSNVDYIRVSDNDIVYFKQAGAYAGGTFNVYFDGDLQNVSFSPNEYDFLDLYSDIPITINKSFAEIQDISKRNSDYSVGVRLPGSKKNNKFFENFFNVDQKSLYFDATAKVQCNVLINDESYFTGYLKLNRVSVQNSKVEYDITLYSNIGDLYGKIGNNLLKDLDFRDPDYHFNHVFNRDNTISGWRYETLKSSQEVPSKYFYPIMHSGYNYEISGNTSNVLLTGVTGTSLYTTTKLGSWPSNGDAYSAGVQRFRINSPEDGLRDNQLKPALNIYSLIKLMFKTYGYTIKSDFMSSPWMKLLYMYGYFSNDTSKFSYKTPQSETFGLDGVDVIIESNIVTTFESNCSTSYPYTVDNWNIYVVKKGTGTPVLCNQEIILNFIFTSFPCFGFPFVYDLPITIPANTTGATYSYVQERWVDCGFGCPFSQENTLYSAFNTITSNVSLSNKILSYTPSPSNTIVEVTDGTYIDFSLIIDSNIKQIDILSSIAKKFNLLFINDPDVPNQIIIEPYDYYIGSGNIYDWTNKLSWDKGFTVEPAQNFVESELILTDLEDGDSGNKEYKDSNSRIYGENKIFNPTEFKSQSKTIDTTFSPQVIRKWNPNNNPNIESTAVGIPLGINYTEQSQEISSGNTSIVDWIYKGVKTKPKLIFNLGNFSPFLDSPFEKFTLSGITTSYFRVTKSDGTLPSGGLISPVISHTMPMGNPDNNKINNDSICVLFNSEEPTTIAGDSVSLFDAFTNQDMYNLFYENRVSNAFDKNTRMISGNFDLKLSDIKNLKPQDLIKINEQYFTWNKIDNYNLTNTELTKVELIQSNYTTKKYPTRYFKYSYCESPETTYKFKTEFIGTESIQESLYYYSILYDYFVGTLGGNVTGYTSSVPYLNFTFLPYSIYEVTEDEYYTSGLDYNDDPYRFFFLLSLEEEPSSTIFNQNNPIWLINSGQTQSTLNVFTECDEFYSTAAEMGVSVANFSPSIVFSSGVTINVTDTGWIRYDVAPGIETNTYFNTLGVQDIPGCVNCNTIRFAYPFADLGAWTVIDCGSSC
jgi:hypothetical protein